MYNKPAQTYVGGTTDKQVTEKPTFVYWIFTQIKGNAIGTLKIRDGWEDTSEEKARIITASSLVHSFFPPIYCASALFVEVVENVTSYTVGYQLERVVKGRFKEPEE